jgi:uracil-DNA glycosylase
MSPQRPDAREVARLLRQQREMGGAELFLDDGTRAGLLELANGGRRTGGSGSEVADAQRAPSPPRAPTRPAAPRRPGTPVERPVVGGAGVEGGRALPVLPASYEALRDEALGCTLCRLSESRTQVVFSDGVVDARLVVVGEAPGANEDATGLPFVGAAGQYLDLLLASVDLSRNESVYICNVLKCRPPGNRNPMPDEIEACSPYLRRQLELIAPRALLAVGTFAAQALTGEQKPLGRLRGEVHGYQGIPLVVTYHPAALLRNPGWTRDFWDDLQLLRGIMD